MTHGIILAAGRGKRLKRLTKHKPKSFNRFRKKKFIDLIIENFLQNKIKKINIITGYKSYLFKKYPFKKFVNKKWHSTNIFYSLLLANKILKKKECIISYSDIIYTPKAIKILNESSGKIVILNNTNWKKSWNLRFKKPLSDLETFQFKIYQKKKYLTEIGKKTKKYSKIQGQYCGLFKITPLGWKRILKIIAELKIDYKKIDITTLLSIIVEKKENKRLIRIIDYNDQWHEVDSLKDLNLLKKI